MEVKAIPEITETTEPQLTEAQINEVAHRSWVESYGDDRLTAPVETRKVLLSVAERDALIRDWRALKARIEALTTDWCECGHSRDKHQFFSDHDECYECDQASPDLCCEWRLAPRPNENDALREQLAQAEKERDEARRWMEIT